MSVLAGIFHLPIAKPVDPARVRAMVLAQTYRGPADARLWTAPGAGLGHRGGAGSGEPLVAANGEVALVCDGVVLNAPALRAELAALGHAFETADDAEVIIHAWRQWGRDCLPRLQGAVSFALVDLRRRCLLLARDRLGIKPLHLALLGDDSLIFSSEIRGLFANPLFRCEVDARAVDDYLALGYVPEDRCLVAGVHRLAPGHSLLIERGKPMPAPSRWWDVDFTARATGTKGAMRAAFRAQLGLAVRDAMAGDAPAGSLLSGGVASSAIVALMADVSNRAVESRTIGADEAGLADGDPVAARFLTHHQTRRIDIEEPAVDALAALFDEPIADPSALIDLHLCQFAGESLSVALAGIGAAGALGDPARSRRYVAAERLRGLIPDRLGRAVDGSAEAAHARRIAVMPPSRRAALYSPGFRRELADYRAEARYPAIMRDAPADDALGRAHYADLILALPGSTLVRADRAARAAGLDLRLPLLDDRLVQLAASLPPAMRRGRGSGLGLIAGAMAGTLPDSVRSSPGAGIVLPVDGWFRGVLVDQAARLARSSMLAETGWFDRAAIDDIATAHLAGSARNGRLLWQLLMLDRALARLFG